MQRRLSLWLEREALLRRLRYVCDTYEGAVLLARLLELNGAPR